MHEPHSLTPYANTGNDITNYVNHSGKHIHLKLKMIHIIMLIYISIILKLFPFSTLPVLNLRYKKGIEGKCSLTFENNIA